jgi:hypothetical protein
MNNAFLVRPTICVWTARKIDKKATKEATSHAGASAKAGVKVYKSVIAADALDKVASIAGAARIEHRKRTAPWSYEGVGAITTEGYQPYKDAMAKYQSEFRSAVSKFLSVYETEREAARSYLGGMFNSNDYPSPASLAQKFSFTLHVEPIPEASTFQADLPPEQVSEIRRDIIASNTTALQNANTNAWGRVLEKVELLKTRLQEYSNGEVTKFYDSWIDNIKELVSFIPSINVANDPDLKAMGRKLMVLTAYSAADLKESVALRNEVVKQAQTVLDGISEAYKNAA